MPFFREFIKMFPYELQDQDILNVLNGLLILLRFARISS
jgi:hypothetical protein